jgi:hypothetical protein
MGNKLCGVIKNDVALEKQQPDSMDATSNTSYLTMKLSCI